MSNRGHNSFTHTPWLVIAVLLLVVSGLIYQTTLMDEAANLTVSQQRQLKEVDIELKALTANWQSEVEELGALERFLDKSSESHRLTELLATTFKGFLQDANKLRNSLGIIEDTVAYYLVIHELDHLKNSWNGSKKILKEHKKLLSTFGMMSNYKVKVDSLNQLLGNEANKAQMSKEELKKALSEIESYKQKIKKLGLRANTVKKENDSLIQISQNQSKILDSLANLLEKQHNDFAELNDGIKGNAALANRLDLWYNLHPRSGKQRFGILKNQGVYYDANDLKIIYGEFSMSADVYKPNHVSSVVLFELKDGDKIEKARARVSVREQKSSEFSLIPEGKLEAGEYLIEVGYIDSIIFNHSFFVSK